LRLSNCQAELAHMTSHRDLVSSYCTPYSITLGFLFIHSFNSLPFSESYICNGKLFMQVVAVPMPLQEDPEVTLGALRWTMDHLHRPKDIIHIVHVIKCMVHKLEVFHGDCSFLSSCACQDVPELNLRCRTQTDIKLVSMPCTHLQQCP
jgi:hypothetical protein